MERICDRLNDIRKKIESRKSEIFRCCERSKDEDQICKESVSKIMKKIDDVIADEETEELDIVDTLSFLSDKREAVKEIEDEILNVENAVDECCSENRIFCKDNLAIAHNKLENYRQYLDEKISDISKVRDERDRFRNATERIRKFVELKSTQLQRSDKSKIDRQLSETNKCCLEIEHEERELFSPIRRAGSLLTEGNVNGYNEIEKEVEEITSLWHSFENEAKQMQADLAGKYKEKSEVVEDLKSLDEMLNNIKEGMKNFKVRDLMSLVEGEEELGDLCDGFEKKQEKIERIFKRADEFCASNLEGDDEKEVSAIALKTRDLNREIKFDLQQIMHGFESIAKRFSMLKKMTDDKEAFVNAICERINNFQMNGMSINDMMEDYRKIELTAKEVENETRQLIGSLHSMKIELPETEADNCYGMICLLEQLLPRLQEILESHHMKLKTLDEKEVACVSELRLIYDELVKFKKSECGQRGQSDLEEMEKVLSRKRSNFERIIDKIEGVKSSFLASECLENSIELNDLLVDVMSLKGDIETSLNDENLMIRNAIERKKALENEIVRSLGRLEEAEGILSRGNGGRRIDERYEVLVRLKEDFEEFENRLSEKFDDYGMAFLPFESQEEIKRQMVMLIDRANQCRHSLDSQLSFLKSHINLKQKQQSELEQCLDEIKQMEDRGHLLNEKEFQMLSERLDRFASEHTLVEDVVSSAENKEFFVVIDDAKDRLLVLCAKMAVTVDVERELDDEMNEMVVSEDQIKPQTDAHVESGLGVNFKDDSVIVEEESAFDGSNTEDNNREPPQEELRVAVDYVDATVGLFETGPEQSAQKSIEELESIEELRERINKHSQSINTVDEISNELANSNNLQHCIDSIKHCLKNVDFVLDDIPDLCKKLDEHEVEGSVAEVSQLLNDIQALEEICKLTRENLNAKCEQFFDLKTDSARQEDKFKSLNLRLQMAANNLLGQTVETIGHSANLEEAQEAIDAVKVALAEGVGEFFIDLPAEEKETLLQTEAELEEKLHEAEKAYRHQMSIEMVKDSILRLDSIKCLLSKYAGEAEKIKGSEATRDSIEDIEKILRAIEEARNEMLTIKSTADIDFDKVPADVIEELDSVSQSVEGSLEKLEIEVKQILKSKQVMVQMEDEIKDLYAVVIELDQRCDKILAEEDLMVVISGLNDSIQEIASVTERVPEIQKTISQASMDLRGEQCVALRGQLDLVASKNLEIQQKLTMNYENFEQAEKMKENLNETLNEMKVDANEFNDKMEDLKNIDVVQEIQDLLKFYEFKLQEMSENLLEKASEFKQCSDYIPLTVQTQAEFQVDVVQKAFRENSRKLVEMQKLMRIISNVVNDAEETVNRSLLFVSTELADEISSEEQTNSQLSLLTEYIDELSLCQERMCETEMEEGFQKLEKSADVCDIVASQILQGFREKMKEQILCAKDECIKKRNIEQDKLSLLGISAAVFDVEKSLSEMHSFAQRQVQVDDREKDMRTAKEFIRRIEKQQEQIAKHLTAIAQVQGLNSEKEKLTDELKNVNDMLSATKDGLILRHEKLGDIEKAIVGRNACLKEAMQQLKAIEEQIEQKAKNDKETLKIRLINLEEKQQLVTSIKDKLKECSFQDEEFLRNLSDNEKSRLLKESKRTEEAIRDLESGIAKEIQEAELILHFREKLDEMKELNETVKSFHSELKSEKIIAEPSVFREFIDHMENCNVDFSVESEHTMGFLEEFNREKEITRIDILDAERTNEELAKCRKKAECLDDEMKTISKELFRNKNHQKSSKEGKVAAQIRNIESGVMVKRRNIEETERMIYELEAISSWIPQQQYGEMKRQILGLADSCKEEIKDDLDKAEELTGINKLLEVFQEKARNFISMKFDPPEVLHCTLGEVENAIVEFDLCMEKLSSAREDVEVEMNQIDNILELLSQEEKDGLIKIKRDVSKKTDSMTRDLEVGKSRCNKKLAILEKLLDLKNEIETIYSKLDSEQCTCENEIKSSEIEEMKRRAADLEGEVNELKRGLGEDEFNLYEDHIVMTEMELCETRLRETLSKCLIFEKCIGALDSSKSGFKEFSVEKEKLEVVDESDNMTIAEKQKCLQNMREEYEKRELLIAELREDLKENRLYIKSTDYDGFMVRCDIEMTDNQKEVDGISKRMSAIDVFKKDLEESNGSLKRISDALDTIDDVDVENSESIDDMIGLVNLHKELIGNGTEDVERIWSKVESSSIKCADAKDVLVTCAKLMKRLGQLKIPNDKQRAILYGKSVIKGNIERVGANIEKLQTVRDSLDVKSTDGQDKLEVAYDIIGTVEEQCSEIHTLLAESSLDENFVKHSTCDIGQLENIFSKLRCEIVEMRETCQKARETLRLTEEELEKMHTISDDIEGREGKEDSIEEQLAGCNKDIDLLKQMLENFENCKQSTCDIIDYIPEPEESRLKESLQHCNMKLKGIEEHLSKKKDDILQAQKEADVKKTIDSIRDKLEAIKEEEIVGIAMEELESGRDKLLCHMKAIEGLENEISHLNIDESHASEIYIVEENLKEKKRTFVAGCEILQRKIELISAIENEKKLVVDMDRVVEKLEICDENVVNIIIQVEKRVASRKEEIAKLEIELESLVGTLCNDDKDTLINCLSEISVHIDKIKPLLGLARMGRIAFCDCEKFLLDLPQTDQQVSELLESFECGEMLDAVTEDLKGDIRMYETAQKQCQELIHLITDSFDDGVAMVKTKQMMSDYLNRIEQRKEVIASRLRELDKMKERFRSYKDAIEEASTILSDIECDKLPSYTNAMIEEALEKVMALQDKLCGVARKVHDIKEELSKPSSQLPTPLTGKLLTVVTGLQNELTDKEQSLSYLGDAIVKMKNIVEGVINLKVEVDEYSKFFQEESFWNACIEETDNAESKLEALENVLLSVEDLEKAIYSVAGNETDLKSNDVLKTLEDEQRKLVGIKEEMKTNSHDVSKIKGLLSEMQNADDNLAQIVAGSIQAYNIFYLF